MDIILCLYVIAVATDVVGFMLDLYCIGYLHLSVCTK